MFHYPSHFANHFRVGAKSTASRVSIKPSKTPFRLATTRSALPAQTKRQQIQSLRNAISFKQPIVFGTSKIPADQWNLFYGDNGQFGCINLSNPSEAALQHLSEACRPATFGLNKENVHDESYRKAVELNPPDFATTFVVADSSLLDIIRSELLEGHQSNKSLRAELYKLNVYGKGAFFKTHKDTPHSSNMFGSLVVVFPTQHEGGSLKFRHAGREWTFDSAAIVKGQEDPTIAFAAFYSDIDHEVTPVTSGHRVTLTYNLYFSDEQPTTVPAPVPIPSTSQTAFKEVLSQLLSEPTFLPEGGFLGFGLQHVYPVDPTANVQNLMNRLKGSDAIIQRVCAELSLGTTLRVVYEDYYYKYRYGRDFVMVEDIIDYSEQGQLDGTPCSMMMEYEDGKRVRVSGPIAKPGSRGAADPGDDDMEGDPEEEHIDVDWVTDLTAFTVAKTSAVTYGNSAQIDFMYGHLCLLVQVGPPEDRTKKIDTEGMDIEETRIGEEDEEEEERR